MSRIVVIGAGPAGLVAALSAAEAGHQVTVLEAADRVGGMAASFDLAGQRVDYGSHRLHPAAPAPVMARIAALLGDDLQRRERRGRIRLGGRWLGFPLNVADLARNLPAPLGARLALDTAARPFRRLRPVSFDAAIRQRLGPTIAEAFYSPYARKLYGVDATELSPELADRRVSARSPLDVARRVRRARGPEGRTFYYPRRGYGQIAERLAEAATAAGAHLHLGHRAVAVRTGDRPSVDTATERHRTELILSTIPLPELVAALDPPPDATVAAAAGALRTRAMVLVYLVVPRPRYTGFDAHYFPDDTTPTSRLSEPKNYRDGDDPPSRTVLCAEVPCWVGDERWTAGAEELGEMVRADLERAGLPDPDPVAVEVRRLPRVYPVYERATADARRTVERWAGSGTPSSLVTFGRQGLAVPDNLHHVVAMGADAAAAVGGGTLDTGRWQRSLQRFADHVVQD